MNKDTSKGLVQLVCVLFFVLIGLVGSRLMRTGYQPVQENSGGIRELYVDSIEVYEEPYRIFFSTTGIVEAQLTVDIISEVSGRVLEVNPGFYPGDAFSAGEILFKIDPRDFENQIQHLEAEVVRAQTALSLEQAEVAAAREEWEQLNDGRAVPALVAREPQIAEALAARKAAQAQLANARLALERTGFSLPRAGVVLESRIAPGQYVQAGQSYGTVFYRDSLEVSASLNNQELEWLYQTEDLEVEIEVHHLGKTQVYPGQLNRRAAAIDANTRFATVRFGFKAAPPSLLPGVFCRITIRGPLYENVTRIPVSALQRDNSIWVIDSEKKLKSVPADIVFRAQDHIALRNIEGPVKIVNNALTGVTEGTVITEGSSDVE